MTIVAASLKIAADNWTIANASLIRNVGNWKMRRGEWKRSTGGDIGGAGISLHVTSITISSNPDGSAFSIIHAQQFNMATGGLFRWLLFDDINHPWHTKFIGDFAESMRPEGFLPGYFDFSVGGKVIKPTFSFLDLM